MCYQNEQKENVTFGEEGEVGRERRLEKSATPNDALKKSFKTHLQVDALVMDPFRAQL